MLKLVWKIIKKHIDEVSNKTLLIIVNNKPTFFLFINHLITSFIKNIEINEILETQKPKIIWLKLK